MYVYVGEFDLIRRSNAMVIHCCSSDGHPELNRLFALMFEFGPSVVDRCNVSGMA